MALRLALAVPLAWPGLDAGQVLAATGTMALSRVASSVHLPLDLVGGAAIGALAGLGAQRVVRAATSPR